MLCFQRWYDVLYGSLAAIKILTIDTEHDVIPILLVYTLHDELHIQTAAAERIEK